MVSKKAYLFLLELDEIEYDDITQILVGIGVSGRLITAVESRVVHDGKGGKRNSYCIGPAKLDEYDFLIINEDVM